MKGYIFLFEKACVESTLASLAGRPGSGVSSTEGETAADQAMAWLRQAVELKYRNANEIRIEAALDPLRVRADYKLMMMDMAFPADPFTD